VQLDPDVLGFPTAQRECRVADAHHEGIAPGTRLGQDFDVLAVHEAELEQPPLERGEDARVRADSNHPADAPRRESREAHVARIKSEP
jgi:hypothetical protein